VDSRGSWGPSTAQIRDAADALPHFEGEAKKRLATSTGGKTPRPVEKIPEAEEGRSRDQAASAFGVNPHYEREARKRMLAGVKSDPPEKIPGGATGDARDHAASAFGVNPHFEEEAKKRLATSTGGGVTPHRSQRAEAARAALALEPCGDAPTRSVRLPGCAGISFGSSPTRPGGRSSVGRWIARRPGRPRPAETRWRCAPPPRTWNRPWPVSPSAVPRRDPEGGHLLVPRKTCILGGTTS